MRAMRPVTAIAARVFSAPRDWLRSTKLVPRCSGAVQCLYQVAGLGYCQALPLGKAWGSCAALPPLWVAMRILAAVLYCQYTGRKWSLLPSCKEQLCSDWSSSRFVFTSTGRCAAVHAPVSQDAKQYLSVAPGSMAPWPSCPSAGSASSRFVKGLDCLRPLATTG